jgi:hypothetical protein
VFFGLFTLVNFAIYGLQPVLFNTTDLTPIVASFACFWVAVLLVALISLANNLRKHYNYVYQQNKKLMIIFFVTETFVLTLIAITQFIRNNETQQFIKGMIIETGFRLII